MGQIIVVPKKYYFPGAWKREHRLQGGSKGSKMLVPQSLHNQGLLSSLIESVALCLSQSNRWCPHAAGPWQTEIPFATRQLHSSLQPLLPPSEGTAKTQKWCCYFPLTEDFSILISVKDSSDTVTCPCTTLVMHRDCSVHLLYRALVVLKDIKR